VAKAIYGPSQLNTVTVEGSVCDGYALDGRWAVEILEETGGTVNVTAFGSPTVQTIPSPSCLRLTLRAVELDPQAVINRNAEYALRDQPQPVKDAVEALFQLEQALVESDREALVTVETTPSGPKFNVVARWKKP